MSRELGQTYGSTPNPAADALSLFASVEEFCHYLWTAEPCVVESYDVEKQRVDVRLKNSPEVDILYGIPIIGTTGDLVEIRAWRKGDVGILLFPRTDSRDSFKDARIAEPLSHRCHQGLGAVFWAGPKLNSQVKPSVVDKTATSSDLGKIGPKDSGFAHKSGSHIIFKEGGQLILRGTEVYIGDKDTNPSTFSGVEKGGDAQSSKVKVS